MRTKKETWMRKGKDISREDLCGGITCMRHVCIHGACASFSCLDFSDFLPGQYVINTASG
jgi:hypothetical protein